MHFARCDQINRINASVIANFRNNNLDMQSVFLQKLRCALCCSQGKAELQQMQCRRKARVLVVLTGDSSGPARIGQKRQLESLRGGAQERDVVLVQARAGSPEAEALRAQLRLGPGPFWAVLVGKDGETKLCTTEPISGRDLAATIDAMPMRQDEMRQRDRTRS